MRHGQHSPFSRLVCQPSRLNVRLILPQVDKVMSQEKETKECGATASVVLLKSLDNLGYFQSNQLALTVAHVG